MISWQPSGDGHDPTYSEPLQMLNLGGLPPEAHADMNTCLRTQLQGSEGTLQMGAATPVLLAPSGIIMDAGGMMESLADYEVDYHYDDDAVLTALNNMFGEVTGKATELRCMTLGYKVRMRVPGDGTPQDVTIAKSTEWQQKDAQLPPGVVDALCVDVEHRAGIALRVFMPYTYQQQRLLLGGLLSVPYQPRVWR
ncbi:hypothetical protein ACFOY2_48540 [Nonomuraea purpurea]|uniref:Uncharacterized protein n=1 Tax=Nonomuraea purpurea TaxID=1849276 RepID=A0ABV8GMI3_9ACTN